MNIPFPIKGIHKGGPTGNQPVGTSPDLNNVRLFDVLDDRARGGQRPGLDKWGAGDQIGGAEQPVVAIISVSSVI